MIDKAVDFATKAHQGQKRKDGTEYIFHPIAVMNAVSTNDEKIVAILHDVIEDTDFSIEDLEFLTDKQKIALEIITKGSESYSEYIDRVKSNKIARAVKIEDIRHNLLSHEKNEALSPEQVAKYQRFLNMLIHD